jgi:hypothetical protein
MKTETIDLLDTVWTIFMVLIFSVSISMSIALIMTEVETYQLLHHKEEADACNKAFRTSDGE